MQATPRAEVVVGPQGKAPTVTVYTDAGDGAGRQVLQIPTSHNEMAALLARRSQLSDQLNSVTDRRNDLIEQIRTAPSGTEEGLQSQLKVLDARVLQLETDLGTVGREVAAATPQLISMADEPSGKSGGEDFAQGMAAAGVPLFLVMSAIFFFSRRRWKREARRGPPVLPSADSERLQRLEHGVEAMAIEIERISEGQRFVTRLLSQTHASESTVGR